MTDPTYTDLAKTRQGGTEWRREGMCNQCGVLVLDTDIHTKAHHDNQLATPGETKP